MYARALVAFIIALLFPSLPFAADGPSVAVTLFGQPCTLKGPTGSAGPSAIDKKSLEAIHAISPAEMPPIQSQQQAKTLLDRLQKATALPPELKNYTDQFKSHVNAYITYFDAIAAAKKEKSAKVFLDQVQPVLRARGAARLKKLAQGFGKDITYGFLEEMNDAFSEATTPRPEAEFHRTIKRLGIHYSCSFEGGK
ncbi:MAG: hypothetical protein AB7P04_11625 [Bacteriovoracia bacterium]